MDNLTTIFDNLHLSNYDVSHLLILSSNLYLSCQYYVIIQTYDIYSVLNDINQYRIESMDDYFYIIDVIEITEDKISNIFFYLSDYLLKNNIYKCDFEKIKNILEVI